MGVNLWYPGLMALVGILLAWVLTMSVFQGEVSYASLFGMMILIGIPLTIAFAIIGWLWGSKR